MSATRSFPVGFDSARFNASVHSAVGNNSTCVAPLRFTRCSPRGTFRIQATSRGAPTQHAKCANTFAAKKGKEKKSFVRTSMFRSDKRRKGSKVRRAETFQAQRRGCVCSAAMSFTMPQLIAPTNHWGVWTALLVAGSLGLWSEKTEWGQRLSGPLVSTLIGLALSNLGVIPVSAPAYLIVNKFLLPLTVPLLLFQADLNRVLRDTGRLLGAFFLGGVGTTVGTLVALKVLPLVALGENSWKMAAALMSRHIGGAVNYVAVTEALQVPPSLNAAGLAADNLICVLYFTTVYALATHANRISKDDKSATATSAEPNRSQITAESQPNRSQISGVGSEQRLDPAVETSPPGHMKVLEASTALAVSASLCAVGAATAQRLNIPGGDIPLITLYVITLATVFPKVGNALAPAGEGLATILLQVFFATVGAAGSISQVLTTAPALFGFSFVQIAVHLGIVLSVGPLLGFSLKELLLASNANVGGPTTAAGMANAQGWRSLLVPTILVGILGYAVATFASIALGFTVLRHM